MSRARRRGYQSARLLHHTTITVPSLSLDQQPQHGLQPLSLNTQQMSLLRSYERTDLIGPLNRPHHSAITCEQTHRHSAPNITQNFSPVHPPHPRHPPPPLPLTSTKCPRHGILEKKLAVENSALSSKLPARSRVKDTKEIMKKRRERAICVVSVGGCLATVIDQK